MLSWSWWLSGAVLREANLNLGQPQACSGVPVPSQCSTLIQIYKQLYRRTDAAWQNVGMEIENSIIRDDAIINGMFRNKPLVRWCTHNQVIGGLYYARDIYMCLIEITGIRISRFCRGVCLSSDVSLSILVELRLPPDPRICCRAPQFLLHRPPPRLLQPRPPATFRLPSHPPAPSATTKSLSFARPDPPPLPPTTPNHHHLPSLSACSSNCRELQLLL